MIGNCFSHFVLITRWNILGFTPGCRTTLAKTSPEPLLPDRDRITPGLVFGLLPGRKTSLFATRGLITCAEVPYVTQP